MALIETAFSFVCAMTVAQVSPYCNKVADAATRQMGIRADDDKFEGQANAYALMEAKSLIGEKGMVAGGVGFVGYQLYTHQPLGFDAPMPVLCDSISGNINTSGQYALSLKWYWK